MLLDDIAIAPKRPGDWLLMNEWMNEFVCMQVHVEPKTCILQSWCWSRMASSGPEMALNSDSE